MSGYKLPGVELTDVTDIQTPRASSSQRLPCIIGSISPYSKVLYEEMTRIEGEPEILSMHETGIVKILQCGSQKGLSNILEGKDITVDKQTGEITWLKSSETQIIESGVPGLSLFPHLGGFTGFNESVPGEAATQGYAHFGLDLPGGLEEDSTLDTQIEYDFKINDQTYTITTPDATTITIGVLLDLLNGVISTNGFKADLKERDIVITNNIFGVESIVNLAAGTTNDLFANLKDVPTPGSSIDGQNATSGYQELGLSVASITDAGLGDPRGYYFKVNSQDYFIETIADTTTYGDIVDLINIILLEKGFTCTFEDGDIRITNTTTTGPTSLVVLGISSDIVAKNNQLKVRLKTAIENDAYAGRLKVTATTSGGDLLTFGIADDIVAGDVVIVLSGDNNNLQKLRMGMDIILESTPVVSAGGSYFISYTYNRPESDYVYQEFTKSDDLRARFGDNIPNNSAVMLGCLGFDYFNLPRIGFVPVKASNRNSDYVEALQKCKNRDVQTLAVANSSSTVRNAVISHLNERNLPKNGKYRMYYTGAPVLTPVGDITTNNSIAMTANSIKNECVCFINATRGKVYYKDPDTNEDTAAVVDGAFLGAAIALYRDSFPYAARNLLRYTIPGIELFAEDFEDYYTDDALIAAGEGSAFLVGLGANNSMYVVDDLTTDNTSVESNNINIITVKHYIAKDVARNLDNVFIGSLITNRQAYQINVSNFLHTLFASYQTSKIIEQLDKIEVSLPSIRRDTVKIKYSYYAVYSHKYVEGEYSLSI